MQNDPIVPIISFVLDPYDLRIVQIYPSILISLTITDQKIVTCTWYAHDHST